MAILDGEGGVSIDSGLYVEYPASSYVLRKRFYESITRLDRSTSSLEETHKI